MRLLRRSRTGDTRRVSKSVPSFSFRGLRIQELQVFKLQRLNAGAYDTAQYSARLSFACRHVDRAHGIEIRTDNLVE